MSCLVVSHFCLFNHRYRMMTPNDEHSFRLKPPTSNSWSRMETLSWDTRVQYMPFNCTRGFGQSSQRPRMIGTIFFRSVRMIQRTVSWCVMLFAGSWGSHKWASDMTIARPGSAPRCFGTLRARFGPPDQSLAASKKCGLHWVKRTHKIKFAPETS